MKRQLIARIEEDLHRKLTARARREGRSLNSLVTEALTEASAVGSSPEELRARIQLSGRRVMPPQPSRVPSRASIEKLTTGTGSAVSEALSEERSLR